MDKLFVYVQDRITKDIRFKNIEGRIDYLKKKTYRGGTELDKEEFHIIFMQKGSGEINSIHIELIEGDSMAYVKEIFGMGIKIQIPRNDAKALYRLLKSIILKKNCFKNEGMMIAI